MLKLNYPPVGTICHNTLRTGDLVDAFSWELSKLLDRNKLKDIVVDSDKGDADAFVEQFKEIIDEHRALVEECNAWLNKVTTRMTLDQLSDHEEEGMELRVSLEDALNWWTPEYMYFGAHSGNGSDFGFWPDFDSLEEAVREKEVLKVSDMSEVPSDYEGHIMHVNDHGNVSLYRTRIVIVHDLLWDCV